MDDGRVRDRMPEAIAEAIRAVFGSYSPDYSSIRCPVLSFFSIRDGSDFLSTEYMSEDQQRLVLDFFARVLGPCQRKQIEGFRRQLPGARIVEIPGGHHYCFLKHEDLVVREMTAFLGG
jgi:pimeloyl-ACP methyl ester carboxylesterase